MKTRFFLLTLCIIFMTSASFGRADISHETISWHASSAPVLTNNQMNLVGVSARLNASGGYDLPMITQTFKFPHGSKVLSLDVVSLQQAESRLSEPLPIIPAKPTLDGAPLSTAPVTNRLMSAGFYPNCHYELEVRHGLDPETLHPTVFATVRLYPVRVNGTQVQYLTSFEATLNVTLGTESTSRGDAAMLVIAPQEFIDVMGDYISHKTDAGLTLATRSLEDIVTNGAGRDPAEKIKHAIADAYDENPLSFVLLAGDADRIPVRYCFHAEYIGRNDWDNIPADLYYADLYDGDGQFCDWDGNGNDLFAEYINGNADECDFAPDVLIGRIPASTVGELTGVLNKIIHYEDSVTGTEPWQNRIILAAADTFTAEEHGDITGYPEGEVTKELIAGESLSEFDLIKLYETDRYPHTAELTTESLNTAILNGAQYVNFANHGWVQGWAFMNGGYSVTEVDALDNYDHLPLVFGYACSTGVFDTENQECPSFGVDKCLAEAFILNANGGAAGYFGASRTAFAGGHGLGGHLGAFGFLDRAVFHGVGQGHTVQGRLWLDSLMALLLKKGISDTADFITVFEYHFFGDPTVSAGGAPLSPDFRLMALNPDDAAGGDGDGCVEPGESIDLPIQICNDGAAAHTVTATLSTSSSYIAIVNGTATMPDMARGTRYAVDPSFSITIDAACPMRTIHDLTITVTAAEKTTDITGQLYVGDGPYLTADTLWVTQDTNNDNLPNPGESVKFAPGFLNIGCETATGITSAITIDDPWVLEYGIKGDGVLPDLPPHVPVIPQRLFTMDLDPLTPDGHVITCDLTFTSPTTNAVWNFSIPMTVRDTVMPVISEFTVIPAIPNPGQDVTITVKMEDPAGVQSAEVSITSFDMDEVITGVFYDDGQHNDGAAGDMVFGAQITLPIIPCYMSADVFAEDNFSNYGVVPNAGGVVTVPFISDDKILVVGRADNDLNIGLYTQALEDAGYGYDVWSYYRGLPPREILDRYVDGAVIFYYSFTYPYLDQTERDLVDYYLNQGGNFLITEQDIGWVMTEAGTSSMTDWYNNTLLANYIKDDSGFKHVEGSSGFSGVEFDLFEGSGADNQDYPSLIEPIAPAETCFVYSDETGSQPGAAGIRAERNGGKLIYLAFGFEGIDSQKNRAETMNAMMSWFGMEKGSKMCPFNQIPGPWIGPEIPVTATNVGSAFCESTMKMYQAGGSNAGGLLVEPSIYYTDTATGQSGDTGVDLATKRMYVTAACLDDHGREKIFFIGGVDATGNIIRDVEVYDPVAKTISGLTQDPLPTEIDGIPGSAAVAGNKLFIIGLARMAEPFQNGRTWVFDPMAEAGSRWSILSTVLDSPRFFAATAVLDNKIYLMGGISQINQEEVILYPDVSVLDTTATAPQWLENSVTPLPEAMFFHAGVAVPRGTNVESAGKIFVCGGGTATNGNVALWYDADTNTWNETWPLQNQRFLYGSLHLIPGARGPAIWTGGGHFGKVYSDTEIRYLGDNPTNCWVGVRTYPETVMPGCSLRMGLDIAGDTAATQVDCYIAMEIAGTFFFMTADPAFPNFTSDPLPLFAGAALPEDLVYCGPLLEIPFPSDLPPITGTFYAASLISGTADFAGGLASASFIVP